MSSRSMVAACQVMPRHIFVASQGEERMDELLVEDGLLVCEGSACPLQLGGEPVGALVPAILDFITKVAVSMVAALVLRCHKPKCNR